MSDPALLRDPDVLAEAARLARPVTLLRPSGECSPIAYWGGTPSVLLPTHLVVTAEDDLDDGLFYDHRLSVDATHLPHPLPGCLSVFTHAEAGPLVLHDPQATLQCQDGTPLYGMPKQEGPHLNALFRHGSSEVQRWVAGEVGRPVEELLTWSDLPTPSGSALAKLDQELRGDHPMWAGGVAAQLGGWCWGWPDQEWDERERNGETLQLVTYEDSEPWTEVWWTGAVFVAVDHLT